MKKYMLENGLRIAGKEHLSPSDYMMDIYQGWKKANASELQKLREALGGKTISEDTPFRLKNHIRKMRTARLKDKIAKSIDMDQLYEWMREKKFPGSRREAQFVLGNSLYETHVKELRETNKITVNKFTK